MKKFLDSSLRSFMNTGVYKKVRAALVYRPDDPNNSLQQWPQKDYDGGVDRIQGYRFPAPGSRPEANIPTRSPDQYFDAKRYSNDFRNIRNTDVTFINSASNPTLIDESLLERKGSANRKENPAVKAYDPTGLRATVTATWAEMDKALEAEAVPDHLPTYEWVKDYDSIVEECDRKGIPVRIGRRPKMTLASGSYNKVKW